MSKDLTTIKRMGVRSHSSLRDELVTLSFEWLVKRMRDSKLSKIVKDKIALQVAGRNFPQNIEVTDTKKTIHIHYDNDTRNTHNTEEVSSRLHQNGSTAPSNGISMGNGKNYVLDSENDETDGKVSE